MAGGQRYRCLSVTDPARALDRLTDSRFPSSCLLVVHPDPAHVNRVVGDLARVHGWPEIVVGRELSAALLPVPLKNRGREARAWMREGIGGAAPSPVVLTGIDVLFEPSLELEPVGLLRQMARLTPLAAAWPGTVDGHRLAYASPEHGHYRVWNHPSVDIVALPR